MFDELRVRRLVADEVVGGIIYAANPDGGGLPDGTGTGSGGGGTSVVSDVVSDTIRCDALYARLLEATTATIANLNAQALTAAVATLQSGHVTGDLTVDGVLKCNGPAQFQSVATDVLYVGGLPVGTAGQVAPLDVI